MHVWNQDPPEALMKERRKIDFVIVGKNEKVSESLAREVLAYQWPCFSSHFLIYWLINDKFDMVCANFCFLFVGDCTNFLIMQEKYRLFVESNTKKQKVVIL